MNSLSTHIMVLNNFNLSVNQQSSPNKITLPARCGRWKLVGTINKLKARSLSITSLSKSFEAVSEVCFCSFFASPNVSLLPTFFQSTCESRAKQFGFTVNFVQRKTIANSNNGTNRLVDEFLCFGKWPD